MSRVARLPSRRSAAIIAASRSFVPMEAGITRSTGAARRAGLPRAPRSMMPTFGRPQPRALSTNRRFAGGRTRLAPAPGHVRGGRKGPTAALSVDPRLWHRRRPRTPRAGVLLGTQIRETQRLITATSRVRTTTTVTEAWDNQWPGVRLLLKEGASAFQEQELNWARTLRSTLEASRRVIDRANVGQELHRDCIGVLRFDRPAPAHDAQRTLLEQGNLVLGPGAMK